MAVTRISQSSLKQGLKKNKNFVAGIPPVLGRYYALVSETVGSGGAASIEFTNIPSEYKNLQIRGVYMGTDGTDWRGISIRFNGNSSAIYSYHTLVGNGSSTFSGAGTSQTSGIAGQATSSTNIPAPAIVDILDYSDSSKNTVIKTFSGIERNTTPSEIILSSTLINITNPITSIILYPSTGQFRQYSIAALYGVK